ncbi:MAG: polyhydroxyalkanoate synthesis repressor PhaR [Alphaproteobacteria bacterium]
MPPRAASKKDAPVTIKKYANRRLYNTATSSYVTLDHLCGMVKEGTDFVVYDAKTGEDITHSVLTQIIMEEESKGRNLLPIGFLRQLIGFYGDSLSSFVPRYLELSMETFSRNQEQMRSYLEDAFGGFFPFKQIEEMGKTNMAMFQRAMDMFAPFGAGHGDEGGDAGATAADHENELADLKLRLNAMQRQLDEIAKKRAK